MTLKEELEILRGEPIEVFDGDPMDIPCIETSNKEKLCKQPVVSVQMTTYNHELYIRRAIEGVVMQETDFEFELVIGEDCSQDKTREICFEYQKKYPDKIRVLWWYENVLKLGGNSSRVSAHCRGEFIAFCEGDDYWIDPLKLQKQVNYMRGTDSVMCVANSQWHFPNGHVSDDIYRTEHGLLTLDDFLNHYFHTTTYLLKRDVLFACKRKYTEMIVWYDCVMAICMATMGSVCFLPDIVSVYNWTGNGISGCEGSSRREIMLAVQFTQFAYCSNPTISRFFTSTAIHFIMKNIVFGVSKEGYKYTQKMRTRARGVVERIYHNKYGRIATLLHITSCLKWTIWAWMVIYYLRHPTVGKYWRRIKHLVRS